MSALLDRGKEKGVNVANMGKTVSGGAGGGGRARSEHAQYIWLLVQYLSYGNRGEESGGRDTEGGSVETRGFG